MDGQTMNSNIKNGNIDLENLEDMDHNQLAKKLDIFKTRLDPTVVEKKDYVITTDNFLKMCVIYLRVQS